MNDTEIPCGPVVLTRTARQAELEQRGATGEALECLLKETTHERHLSRVAYALWAAEEYYLAAMKLDRDEASLAQLTHGASMILWSDVIGIGGRDGVEGFASERHPAFAGCGKGRKQATDGAAWSAAIREAASGIGGGFTARPDCLIYEIAGECESAVIEELVPREWMYSILREGLRRAAGLRVQTHHGLGWHPSAPIFAPPESLGAWAHLVNDHKELEPAGAACTRSTDKVLNDYEARNAWLLLSHDVWHETMGTISTHASQQAAYDACPKNSDGDFCFGFRLRPSEHN